MNGFLRGLVWLGAILGAIWGVIYYAYADTWVIPLDDPRMLVSIEPSLRGGDLVMVARHGPPDIGDLVRCTDPDEPRRTVIGRLVGTDGSAVTILDQRFTTPGSREAADTACGDQHLVNPATGEELDLQCNNRDFAGRSYQILTRTQDHEALGPIEVKVPRGKSYLLSDDRYLHLDSRDYGMVSSASCQHILFRLWGPNGFTDGSRRFNIVW
jgi:signal peptidase I